MFEKVRERVVYPSSMEYQKSEDSSVNAGWAGGYLKQLSDKYPGARIENWNSLRVVSEITMSDQEILEEKLRYVKEYLANLDEDHTAVLSKL
jgi:hypothetical protein